MTHTPQRSPFSAEHQAIALSISIFSNTIQVLIWPLLVYVPHVREISKEKAPLVWHNEPCRYFKKRAFPKHKIIMTESWEKNGAVFEGKHAMWKTKHMTPRWEGLPCVCVREGFKRLEDESTSVVGHTHTPLSLAAIWASLGRPQGDYGRATSPKSFLGTSAGRGDGPEIISVIFITWFSFGHTSGAGDRGNKNSRAIASKPFSVVSGSSTLKVTWNPDLKDWNGLHPQILRCSCSQNSLFRIFSSKEGIV